jgi:hypothetical protein
MKILLDIVYDLYTIWTKQNQTELENSQIYPFETMLEIITEDYIIFIDMNYLLREIDIKEDDDALKRSPKELYERIVDNLYWDEMVEE